MDFITTLKKLLAQAGNTYNNVVNAPFDRIGAEAKKINASIPQNLPVLERAVTAAPQIARSISNNMYRDVPVAHQAFSYVGNRMAAPIADIPKSVMDLRTVPEMIKRRDYLNAAMTAASPVLNTAYTVGNIINPIGTQAANQIFTKFDAGKGVVNAIRNKQSPMGVADAALKGFTGENVVGLGDSVTSNKDLANKINMGEGLAGLAIPAFHGIKGILKKGEAAPKPELVTAEKRIGLKPKIDPHALNQELPFTTEPVAPGVKPENMGVSKFSQTVVEKGKTTPEVKQILKEEPQMYQKVNLGEVADNASKIIVTEDHIKRFTADDFKPKDFGDNQKTFEDATAAIQHLNEQGRHNEAAVIFNKMSQSGTAKGQWNSMLRVLLDQTPQGKVASVVKIIEDAVSNPSLLDRFFRTKRSKFKVTEEFKSELTKKAQEISMLPESQRAEATQKFLSDAFGHIPAGANDWITSLRFNSMLSGPVSFSKNFLQNTLAAGIVRPGDILLREGPTAVMKYYVGALKAFGEATRQAKYVMKDGSMLPSREFSQNTMGEMLRKATSKKTRSIATLWGIPTRGLESTDIFFQTLIKAGEIKTGKSPEKAQYFADKTLYRSMLDPNNKDQGAVSQLVDKVGSSLNNLRDTPIGWVTPFIKTVMNVAKDSLERSPVGFVNLINNADKKLQVIKAVQGTAVMIAGLGALTLDNYETEPPRDPEEAKAWYASGRKPWSVKIADKYIPINYLNTYAFPLAIAMVYKDKFERDPKSVNNGSLEKMGDLTKASFKYWLDNTPIQSLNDFSEIFTSDNAYTGMSRLAANTLKQVVPMSGLLRWATQVVDNVYRKPKGGLSFESLYQQMARDIPMLSMGLDPYTDPAGNPSMRSRLQTIVPVPYQVGTANPTFEPMVQQNIQDARLNAQVKANEAMGAQTTPTPESQQTTEMSTIQSILAKKKIEEDKNKLIKSAMNLPPAVQVQMFKNYNITQDDVKNFELKQIKALNTDETATYIMGQKQNDFTKLYQQGVLTTSVAKMLEKKGYIPDASTLMDNLKKTDAYEQKQVMKKATKSYIKKIATLQKRNMKSILSKKSKTFKAPKARKFKAYKAPKIKIPKLKLGRKM